MAMILESLIRHPRRILILPLLTVLMAVPATAVAFDSAKQECDDIKKRWNIPAGAKGPAEYYKVLAMDVRWTQAGCVREMTLSVDVSHKARINAIGYIEKTGEEITANQYLNLWQRLQREDRLEKFWIDRGESPFQFRGGTRIINYVPDQYLQPFTVVHRW